MLFAARGLGSHDTPISLPQLSFTCLALKYVHSSTVSVGIWIPSSASTPQVGFMWSATSPTREETSKFQGPRRSMEVLCSGVPVVSLAGS